MMLRALTVFALLFGAFGGLVAAHSTAMDPVTCGGGQTYPATPVSPAPNDPDVAAHTLYVVVQQDKADDVPGAYQDEDKAGPISIWKENNNRRGLQPTAYECKYADGHVWGVDDETTTTDPQPTPEERAAHPELIRRDSDMQLPVSA